MIIELIKTNFAYFEISNWEHASPNDKSPPNKNAFEYLNTNITNWLKTLQMQLFLT